MPFVEDEWRYAMLSSVTVTLLHWLLSSASLLRHGHAHAAGAPGERQQQARRATLAGVNATREYEDARTKYERQGDGNAILALMLRFVVIAREWTVTVVCWLL